MMKRGQEMHGGEQEIATKFNENKKTIELAIEFSIKVRQTMRVKKRTMVERISLLLSLAGCKRPREVNR